MQDKNANYIIMYIMQNSCTTPYLHVYTIQSNFVMTYASQTQDFKYNGIKGEQWSIL